MTAMRGRAVSYRFVKDDARYAVREKGSRTIVDPGLSPGDPMACDLFPSL